MKESSFIKTVAVEDIKSVELLRRSTGLDAGESEAIILSDKLKASILLMDEVKGRQVAKQMGIQIMGTIACFWQHIDRKFYQNRKYCNILIF